MERGFVEIGAYKFKASDVLKKCNPVAYRQEINDFINNLLEDEDLFEFNNRYFIEPIMFFDVLKKLNIHDIGAEVV
ncbi:hypothetical protein EBR43_05110 [bacterium]|nr:hypothetical protein [bacterium]